MLYKLLYDIIPPYIVYKEFYNSIIIKMIILLKYITKNGTTLFEKMQLW